MEDKGLSEMKVYMKLQLKSVMLLHIKEKGRKKSSS